MLSKDLVGASKNSIINQRGCKVALLPTLNKVMYKFKAVFKENEYVGAEHEIEGINLPDSLGSTSSSLGGQYWKVEIDPSLRNPSEDGGNAYEYILRRPVSPEFYVDKCLPHLKKKTDNEKSRPIFSIRCSNHFHIGVHELYLYQVFIATGLYYIFEDLFWDILGKDRNGFLFCIGTSVSDGLSSILTEMAVTGSLKPIFNHDGFKYTSLNLRPLSNLGTMEFRAMEGTLDEDRIKDWLSIIVAIRNYAASVTPQQAGTLLNMMSVKGPVEFFKDVMGGATSRGYRAVLSAFNGDKEAIKNIIYQGINNIQSMFYEPDWNNIELIDEIPKDFDKEMLYKSRTSLSFSEYLLSQQPQTTVILPQDDEEIPF